MESLMRRWLAFSVFGIIAALATGALAQAEKDGITVQDVWTHATPGNSKTAAVYFTAINRGSESDRITSASTPAASRAEMHTTIRDGDIMRMRRVISVDVPAGGRTTFSPSGFHVMLTGLKDSLKIGDTVPLTLHFDRVGDVTVSVAVRK
jgi:copper(I)-binding protein